MNLFRAHRRSLRCLLTALALLHGTPSVLAAINWDNDVTLTEDTTVNIGSGTYNIGDNTSSDDVYLQSYELTLKGSANYSVSSQLQGAGTVFINLNDDTKIVTYRNSGNNYTGDTRVKSGILDLRYATGSNNLNDLRIGGGSETALVTRNTTSNRELIADTAVVVLRTNGTLEFRRLSTGSNSADDSTETFHHLKMDGGTLLNNSANTARATTVNINTLTLLDNSYIDLGAKMTLTFGDVDNRDWTSGKFLYIQDWDAGDDVFFGDITSAQLAQIRFDLGTNGMVTAVQLGTGEIVPSSTVPEAPALLALPLLAGLVCWRELRQRKLAAAKI